jgi:hypothetical protein
MLDSTAMEEHDPLDVAAILAQIRAEIVTSRGGGSETAHLALGVDLDELRESLAEVEALRAVSAHWPIQGRTPRERAAALAQRLVRRALQWYITPIVQQQNSYNAAVARTLQLLLESQLELAREIVRLRAPAPASDDAATS